MATLPGNPEFPLVLDLVQVFLDSAGFQTTMRETDMATILAARRGCGHRALPAPIETVERWAPPMDR
jgi:hypothetical protein